MTTPQIDDAKIAETAFHLWLDEGRPEGRASDHWYRALETLKAQAAAPKKRKAAAAKAAKTVAAPKLAAKPRAGKAAKAPKA